MSQRVVMKIYRFQDFGEVQNLLSGTNISTWDYIQNKDENNINFSGTPDGSGVDVNVVGNIVLAAEDLPIVKLNANFARPFLVRKEMINSGGAETSRYYVIVDSRKFYLRFSQNVKTLDSQVSIFEFYVNPERVQPVYVKMNTEIRTRGGWEVQHWGNALTEISINGRSGGLHRDVTRPKIPGGLGETLKVGESITDSTAWVKLNQLRKYYEEDRSLNNKQSDYKLGFNYYDRFYIGYFSSFNGPEADSEHPYIVNYSFVFKVEQEIFIGNTGEEFGSVLNS